MAKKMLQKTVRLGQALKSFQSGPKPTMYVKGFDPFEGEDKIRSSLWNHFSKCGETTKISIPHPKGKSKGFAFVHFLGYSSRENALDLDGKALDPDGSEKGKGKGSLTVKKAKGGYYSLLSNLQERSKKGFGGLGSHAAPLVLDLIKFGMKRGVIYLDHLPLFVQILVVFLLISIRDMCC